MKLMSRLGFILPVHYGECSCGVPMFARTALDLVHHVGLGPGRRPYFPLFGSLRGMMGITHLLEGEGIKQTQEVIQGGE